MVWLLNEQLCRLRPVRGVVVGDDKVMQERLGHVDIGVTLNTYIFTGR